MKLDYVIEKDDFDRAGEASGSVKKMLSKLGVAPPVVKRVANIVMHLICIFFRVL